MNPITSSRDYTLSTDLVPFIEDNVLREEICIRILKNSEDDFGFIMSGHLGCGKTSILKVIENALSPACGWYQNDMQLNDFINLCDNYKFILIDDIDKIEDLSVIISGIDNAKCSDTYFVCTSSTTTLDTRLIQNYRLGIPVDLPLLSLDRKSELFSVVLQFVEKRYNISVPISPKQLALECRYHSIGDVVQLSRAIINANTLIDIENILKYVSTRTNSGVSQLNMNTVIPETVSLYGLQKVQMRLLNFLYGAFFCDSVAQRNIPPGLVLYGESGTGKSALVNWLASVSKANFNLIAVSCSDLVHKVVGETEKYISEVFAYARKIGPSLLWLDNLDSILPSRYSQNGRNQRTSLKTIDRLLSTLLVEIDGLGQHVEKSTTSSNIFQSSSVVVIVTVNRLDSLDRSLLRPGRLEEHIELKKPNRQQGLQLLQNTLGKSNSIDELTLKKLIAKYQYKSYAELLELVQSTEFSYLKAVLTNVHSHPINKSEYIKQVLQEKL